MQAAEVRNLGDPSDTRDLHFGVTAHPTAEWTAQQLREAFPWDTAPRYLLRDRDTIFGPDFVKQVKAMGIKQVLSAPRSPWQRAAMHGRGGYANLSRLPPDIFPEDFSKEPPRPYHRQGRT
jgi:hypothetical protein